MEQKIALAVKTYGGLEPGDFRQEREYAWEQKLTALAEGAQIDLSALPAKKSHADKASLAAALKLSTSVSNAWLAARLNMGTPASASQFSRRWLLEPSREAATRALLSRVKP